jgi:hypothetical protein
VSHEIHAKLDQILRELTVVNSRLANIESLIIVEGNLIMADLTALTAEVAAVTTVEQSAITLLEGLSAQLAAAGTDPAKLAALQASLESSRAALAAAVTANTPVAPPAPPAPAPAP